ncbi:hypothetical protein CRYUN_Cryun17cG0117700 [Craigia yunnanensis]
MRLAMRMDGFLQGLIDKRQNANVMLLTGTDTSVVTLEWAMSNLLNHPDVLKKARAKIDAQIGQERLIDEPNITKLPYLQNIMFETLWLYPTAPLLVPYKTIDDCTINGYKVPCDTIILINAWVIHQNPELWDDPTSFKLERFNNEVKDHGHKFMSFGIGWRACLGASLGHHMVN